MNSNRPPFAGSCFKFQLDLSPEALTERRWSLRYRELAYACPLHRRTSGPIDASLDLFIPLAFGPSDLDNCKAVQVVLTFNHLAYNELLKDGACDFVRLSSLEWYCRTCDRYFLDPPSRYKLSTELDAANLNFSHMRISFRSSAFSTWRRVDVSLKSYPDVTQLSFYFWGGVYYGLEFRRATKSL